MAGFSNPPGILARIGRALFGLAFAAAGVAAIGLGLFAEVDDGRWIAILTGALFAAVGLGFMYTALFRNSATKLAEPRFDGHHQWGHGNWPWFPEAHLLKGKAPAGETCLAPEQGRAQSTIVLFVVGIIWTGITATMTVAMRRDGVPGPVTTIFMGVFLLVGIAILAFAIHCLLRLLLVGPTLLLVDRECATPGGKIRYRLRQKGVPSINSATLTLQCREVVRYRQGTDTHTRTNYVHSEPIQQLDEGPVPADGYLMRGEILIPPDAIHSFAAPNNEVKWELNLKLDIPLRPDIDENYPIRVEPDHV